MGRRVVLYRLYDVIVVQLRETYTVTWKLGYGGCVDTDFFSLFALEKVIFVCKTSESERGRVWQKTLGQ